FRAVLDADVNRVQRDKASMHGLRKLRRCIKSLFRLVGQICGKKHAVSRPRSSSLPHRDDRNRESCQYLLSDRSNDGAAEHPSTMCTHNNKVGAFFGCGGNDFVFDISRFHRESKIESLPILRAEKSAEHSASLTDMFAVKLLHFFRECDCKGL